MATAHEFELACPACDGPGIYAIEDGLRLRVGLTSNLSRFVRRQRTPVRLLYVVRLEPGKAPRAWRALLSNSETTPAATISAAVEMRPTRTRRASPASGFTNRAYQSLTR